MYRYNTILYIYIYMYSHVCTRTYVSMGVRTTYIAGRVNAQAVYKSHCGYSRAVYITTMHIAVVWLYVPHTWLFIHSDVFSLEFQSQLHTIV